ncbi:hypothetical protein PtB15_11B320 [Puccinia triticina]|nr:hypothetical protein PtB15_11B320 [Puccinia triticina]
MYRLLIHCQYPAVPKRESNTDLSGTATIQYPSPNQLGSRTFTHIVYPTATTPVNWEDAVLYTLNRYFYRLSVGEVVPQAPSPPSSCLGGTLQSSPASFVLQTAGKTYWSHTGPPQYMLKPEIPLFLASIPDEEAFLNLIEEGLNEEED